MNIALSGELGSGKSTIAKALIERELQSFEIISAGKINRLEAQKRGISTREFNELLQSDKKFDNWLDDQIKAYGESGHDYIFDARLGWLFVPDAFKLHLLCRPEVAAKRVLTDNTRVGEQYQESDQALDEIRKRKESERKRFQEFYGIDINDFANYNLVVDTSDSKVEDIVQLVLDQYLEWKSKGFENRVFVAPISIQHRKTGSGPLVLEYKDRNFFYQEGEIDDQRPFNQARVKA